MGCGLVRIAPPWPTKSDKARNLCEPCWRELTTLIDTIEHERDNWDLPIDQVCGAVGNSRRHNADGGQAVGEESTPA